MFTKTTSIYKLRSQKTGLYWSGGRWGRWVTDGKIYSNIGSVKNGIHHASEAKDFINHFPEIVEFTCTEKAIYDVEL